MLEFGQASGRQIVYRPVELGKLLQGYAEMMALQLPAGIRFAVRVDEGLLPIWVDPKQILRCLHYVILNSADAIDVGVGRITLRVGAQQHKGVSGVALRVTDTGRGIKPEVLPQIFMPFFTTKPRGRGTGMGLAIVRGIIVRGHRGSIDVVSEEGRGTTVVLFLPVGAAASGVGR